MPDALREVIAALFLSVKGALLTRLRYLPTRPRMRDWRPVSRQAAGSEARGLASSGSP